jgi:hypothetical protein
MGRPKLPFTRDKQFNVGLTDDEFATLHRAARLAGMRPVDYARSLLLAKRLPTRRVAEATPHLDPLLLLEISRIGNNLNQIARRLNELALPIPDELPGLLAEVRRILREAQRS